VTDTHAQGSSGRPSPHRSGRGSRKATRARARSRQSSRPPHKARRRTPTHASPARRERTLCFLRFAPALPWILLQLRSCTPCFHLGKGTGGERLTDISRKIWTHHSASVDWPVAAVSDNRSAMDDPYGGQQRQVCAVHRRQTYQNYRGHWLVWVTAVICNGRCAGSRLGLAVYAPPGPSWAGIGPSRRDTGLVLQRIFRSEGAQCVGEKWVARLAGGCWRVHIPGYSRCKRPVSAWTGSLAGWHHTFGQWRSLLSPLSSIHPPARPSKRAWNQHRGLTRRVVGGWVFNEKSAAPPGGRAGDRK